MKGKTTIYDIAKKLNITAATVSRALNNNPRISKATKAMVLEAAAELQYEPNKVAQALKRGKSNTVGVVVPYIDRTFFSTIIRGIEEELYPKGYQVIICQTHDRQDRELDIITNLLNAQVEGIMVSPAKSAKTVEHFEQVLRKHIPLVFFDRDMDMDGVSAVSIDDFKGAYEATQHLIAQGSQRVAHLTVEKSVGIYQKRLEGYQKALADNQLPFDPTLVVTLQSDIEEGKRAAQELMALPQPPDAIFSSTDYAALGAIKWLTANGYQVPDDVRVVGFSNDPFTQLMELSISSVDQCPLQMGKMTAQVFLEQLKAPKTKGGKKVVLPPTLLVRDSSN